MSDAHGSDFLALQQALVGRYSLDEQIGRGAMGAVYLAHEVALDRPVALKVLAPDLTARPQARERFLQAARTAARLSHPNIVQIYAVDELDDFVFFAMAYVDGETLGSVVEREGSFESEKAVGVLREVAWALAYAHAEGVVHGDVKPGNILLENGSGRALLSDFGITDSGHDPGVGVEPDERSFGGFESPERGGGADVDARSDIYSLGLVGYYALTAHLPWEGVGTAGSVAPSTGPSIPPVASVAPGVPAVVAHAIDRCLRPEPGDRFEDGAALAEAMGGTTLKRETPVPLRIFNKKLREIATGVPAIFVIWWLVFGGVIAAQFAAPFLQTLTLFFAAFLLLGSITEPVATLIAQSRRLLQAGFGIEDVCMALEQEVRERTEEIRFEHGKEVTRVDHVLRAITWPAIIPGYLVFTVALFAGSEPFALGSLVASMVGTGAGFVGWFRNKRRRDAVGQGWLSLLRTRVGKWLFKLGGIGLDRAGLLGGGTHRPTEMAISIAADRLYEELPRAARRDLPGLPETIKKLEGDAHHMRRHAEELGELLAEIGDDPTRAGSAERAALRADLEATRDAAQKRMTDAVTALEKIRLGLLRMHAGSGSVEGLTHDLGSARALSEEIAHLLEGKRAVDELLGIAPPPSEMVTPTPA